MIAPVVEPVLHMQQWQRAHAFVYGDEGGGASRLRYQSQLELVCYTRL
jgi:hypothetical protein